MHYQLVTTLTETQSPEWENLVQRALGNEIHPDRKRGFLLSRKALQSTLENLGFKVQILELILVQNHELVGFPQLTISLSHTRLCGAAIVASRKDFRSVGIDVEEETRLVKDSIRERISHPQDGNFRNIELWCAKEAAFKALMNTNLFSKPIEFGSIQILKDKWFHSPSNLEGEWKLEYVNSFVMATAYLKN